MGIKCKETTNLKIIKSRTYFAKASADQSTEQSLQIAKRQTFTSC
jgi:hypothetical protein